MNAELIEKARELFQAGKSPTEIAEKIGVSPGTIRSWKSRGKLGDVAAQRNVAKKCCNKKAVDKQLIRSVESNSELTDQERMFCLHYVKTFHATNSAIRAGYSSKTAGQIGYQLLQKTSIRSEITRLKEIRASALLASADDVVEKYMHIAFADITDFLDFGRAEVPVMGPFGPIEIEDPNSGEKIKLTKKINEVRFKESSEIDGTLLSEVKQGKDGASVKLADRMKALAFLRDYFELNPSDRHKQEYDKRRLEIEMLKTQAAIKPTGDDTLSDDGFAEALNAQAAEVWKDEDSTDGENNVE